MFTYIRPLIGVSFRNCQYRKCFEVFSLMTFSAAIIMLRR